MKGQDTDVVVRWDALGRKHLNKASRDDAVEEALVQAYLCLRMFPSTVEVRAYRGAQGDEELCEVFRETVDVREWFDEVPMEFRKRIKKRIGLYQQVWSLPC